MVTLCIPIAATFPNLEHDMTNLLYWFKSDSLKTNPRISFMIFGKKNRQKYGLETSSKTFVESDQVELLGITIDKDLNFKKHIKNLCPTAQYKVHALRRIRKYLALDKAKLLGNPSLIGSSTMHHQNGIYHKTTYLKTLSF